jgi:hypothetical protein
MAADRSCDGILRFDISMDTILDFNRYHPGAHLENAIWSSGGVISLHSVINEKFIS